MSAQAQPASPPHRDQLAAKFRTDLERLAAAASGVVGLSVIDLSSGQRFDINESLIFPQGSAIKIPVLIELFRRADRGELKLSDRLPVQRNNQVGGSGLLQYFSDGGSELSLHDLAIAMVVLSDNSATNVLIDRLGMEQVSRTMAEMGAGRTKLQRKMIRPEESARGNENLSTPMEAADLMARIARCDLPVSAASCARIRTILEIPKSGGFRDAIPASVPVAWKPGGIEGAQTAWGLVNVPGGPYAIAIMINYGGDDADMERLIRAISAAAYKYFTQIARTTPYGTRVPLEYIKQSLVPDR